MLLTNNSHSCICILTMPSLIVIRVQVTNTCGKLQEYCTAFLSTKHLSLSRFKLLRDTFENLITYFYWGERERVPPWEFNAPSVYIYICRTSVIFGPAAPALRANVSRLISSSNVTCSMLYICSKRQPGHHYTYRASTHVQQLSDNQQRVRLHMRERSVYSSSLQDRLEAETTHEREECLQQLSDNQQRKLDTETTALRSRSPHNA